MNTRYTLFDSPLLLGFDHLERMIDRATKSSQSGYPPYNIEQISENGLRITLAVAGFTMDDLSVAIEDKHLVIRGRQDEVPDENRIFLHRGIATRQFQRVFLLADEIAVKGAHLDNGLLHVDLLRLVPEKKIQPIPIHKGRTPAAMEIDGHADAAPALPGAANQPRQPGTEIA